MFCPQCGTQVPGGSAFCQECGARVLATTTPGSAVPTVGAATRGLPTVPIVGVVSLAGLAGVVVAVLFITGVIGGAGGGTNERVSGTQTSINPSPSAFNAAEGKIAFACGGTIYVMNADGSGQKSLPPDVSRSPVWSPDGKRMAFQFGTYVGVMNADGSGLKQLNRGSSPTWSPDGTRIAYSAPRGGAIGNDVYVIDADGSDETRLTGGEGGWDPAWSPDGSRIAFWDGRTRVYVMNPDGSSQTRLADVAGFVNLTWSPDGKQIALTADGIEVVNADGTGLRRLGAGGSPAWSPDGKRIVFLRGADRDHGGGVYVMNADGTSQKRLADLGGVVGLTWSPDGSYIAYASGLVGIYVVSADGSSSPTHITEGAKIEGGADLGFVSCEEATWFIPAQKVPAPKPTEASTPSGSSVLATYPINISRTYPNSPGSVMTVPSIDVLRDGTIRVNLYFTNNTGVDINWRPAADGTVYIIDEAGERYDPLQASPGWNGANQPSLGVIHDGERIDGWLLFPVLRQGVISFSLQLEDYQPINGIRLPR